VPLGERVRFATVSPNNMWKTGREGVNQSVM